MVSSVYYSNRVETGSEMKSLNNFNDANDYIWRFHDAAKTRYTLDNMTALMKYLGNPQNRLKIIHVAGTSGKTSTSYFVTSLLSQAGKRVGSTVSPVVDEVNERVQVNNMPLEEKEFCLALSAYGELVESAPVKPSAFELMMGFAFWYFNKVGVDYAVIEVGLGGLKDASNVIRRADKVCLITDIGYDHTSVLGKSLREIATQKAGIIHDGNQVFTHQQTKEAMAALSQCAVDQGGIINLLKVKPNPYPHMPDYQYRNWSLAYAAYSYLLKRDGFKRLSPIELDHSRHTKVPGRMDIQQLGFKTIVMDGAHNPQKMEALVSSFRKLFPGKKPAVLVAMRSGKDHGLMADYLSDLATSVITTEFELGQNVGVRSMPAKELAKDFSGQVPVIAMPDVTKAYQQLLSSENDLVLITGSIYLIGQIRGVHALKA